VATTGDNIEKGRRIREARIAKGLNQKEVAEQIGANPATISNIEKGRMGVTRERAEALGPVLDVDPDDLAEVVSLSLLRRLESIEFLLGLLVPRGLLEDDAALAQAERMVAEAQALLQRRAQDETPESGS